MCWLRDLFLSALWLLFTQHEAGYPEALGVRPPPKPVALE